MDIDGDGHRDILSGSYSRMQKKMAGLFQVLYGKADGTFRKAEALQGTDGEPLIIPADEATIVEAICTRPFAIDWNGDDRLDLVVGNFAGSFYLFKGEGQGKFQPQPELLKTGDEPLHVEGHHSDPFAIDWDGDGDLDLLSGSANGGVQWAENSAGAGKPPKLRPFRMLIEPDRSMQAIQFGQPLSEDELTGPANATRVWVADVNEDGKLDLLVGDTVTLVAPANGLSAEAFKQEFADWQEALNAASKAASAASAEDSQRAEARSKLSKLYRQRSEFMQEDRTGFVWLYLQK